MKNEEIWRRNPDQKKKVGLAGSHSAKTNLQHGKPCSKMEPTREKEEREDPAHIGYGLCRLKGGLWDTPWVNWNFCFETGPNGGSFRTTYARNGVQWYKSSQE